jgi:hypothetical protein
MVCGDGTRFLGMPEAYLSICIEIAAAWDARERLPAETLSI